MSLVNIVLGASSGLSATVGCAMYGVTDAKGTPLPGREFVWPGTGIAALCVGSSIALPDNDPSLEFCGVYTVGMGVVGAAFYGLGYFVGKLT